MRSRVVRSTLTLLAVGAIAAAAYFSWTIEQRAAIDSDTVRAADARIANAARLTLELRGAQQAYVAAGQSEQFWISKVASSYAALDEVLTALRVSSLPATSRAAIERAIEGLQEFDRTDRRARDYAANGQKLLASDLIFSDGLESTGQILDALDDARGAQAAAAEDVRRAARLEQLMYVAGGAAAALFALLILLPVPRQEEPPIPTLLGPIPVAAQSDDPFDRMDVPLAPPAPSPEPSPAPVPELRDVADVCVQLARLVDTATLPALLQRTALALDASGIVLWVADPDATELVPVAAHGYAPGVLAKMGTIQREAENVTAAAFRTGLLQIVKADTMANGAIAAPLVNQSGCIGVMSAELRHEGETQPARQALATIVAAQLATLVAPTTRTEKRAAL